MKSKFEILYLIRKSFFPAFLIISSIYVIVKSFTCFSFDIAIIGLVLFISGLLAIILNFSSVYKIVIEKEGIKKIFLLTNKIEFIPFASIKSSRLEFIQGSYSDAGQITPGFYTCVFSLVNGTEFILTPEHYQNYNQLIKQISINRSE